MFLSLRRSPSFPHSQKSWYCHFHYDWLKLKGSEKTKQNSTTNALSWVEGFPSDRESVIWWIVFLIKNSKKRIELLSQKLGILSISLAFLRQIGFGDLKRVKLLWRGREILKSVPARVNHSLTLRVHSHWSQILDTRVLLLPLTTTTDARYLLDERSQHSHQQRSQI